MDCDLPPLFRLPQELRDHIYSYFLLEPEEVRLSNTSTDIPWTVLEPRYQARIQQKGSRPAFTAVTRGNSMPAPLGQVNRQLRGEMSDFLELSQLPVVARVQNFDFEHVLQYFATPISKPRLSRHTVRDDGTVPHKLMLELVGPYDDDWRANLERWIGRLHHLMPQQEGELGALYKTVPWNGYWAIRTPPEIVREMREMHEAWPPGAGRGELWKVLVTLYIREHVEEMMGWQRSCLDVLQSGEGRARRVGWK